MDRNRSTKKFSPEAGERAVRMVFDHQAGTPRNGRRWFLSFDRRETGCNAETLRHWVRRAERDAGARPGLTSDERARLKALERENRELRQANEILRKASAYFAAAELDRRSKT